MRADRFTALLDANVLGPGLTRSYALELAGAGFYRARWSPQILDEAERYIAGRTNPENAKRQRKRIEAYMPEAMVEGHEVFTECYGLPDEDDHHVLAAAIQTTAAVIVTDNIKDFPSAILDPFHVEAVRIDDFIADIIDLGKSEAISAIHQMRQPWKKRIHTGDDLIIETRRVGLTTTADLLGEYREFL